MAAPAFGSVGSTLAGSFTSGAVVPVPPSVAAGDVVLVVIYKENTAAITPPAGFTQAPDSPVVNSAPFDLHVFWKRATAGDTGTYSFTWSGSQWRSAFAARYTGCVTSGNPFDVTAFAAKTTSTDGSVPAVSDTTTGADRLLVWIAALYNEGTCTTPTGFTERADISTGNALALDDKVQAASGSTGSITATFSANGQTSAWLGALLPVASTVPQGSATVTYTWAVAAAGKRSPRADATVTHTWAVSAAGKRSPKGSATVTHTWAVTAIGQTPGQPSGSASVTFGWTVSAAGDRHPLGASSIAYAWAVTAEGRSPGIFSYVAGVSANGRYLVDQHGAPFQCRGDAPWAAMYALTTTALVDEYVEARVEQGYNTFLVSAIVGADNGNPSNDGETSDGVAPFTAGYTLNSTYWARLDYLLTKCRDEGVTVFLYVLDSWLMQNSGDLFFSASNAQCEDYAESVATRYANTTTYPNIVWMVGGDYVVGETKSQKFAAAYDGVRGTGDTRLMSLQVMFRTTDYPTGHTWMDDRFDARGDFDFVYTYFPSYREMADSYEHVWDTSLGKPATRPSLLAETRYLDESGPGAAEYRYNTAYGYLCGSPGEIWGTQDWDFGSGWQSRLNEPEHAQMGALRDWFGSIDWHTLVPDEDLVLTNKGTRIGASYSDTGLNDYAMGAIGGGGTFAVIYIPTSRTFTVDTSLISGAADATWVDPVSGDTSTATFSNSYTTPGTNDDGATDWLLLIEGVPSGAASFDYGWSIAAAGRRSPKSSGVLSYGWSVTVSGGRASIATVSVSYTWALAAMGNREPDAAAAVTFTWSLAAAGKRDPESAASAGYAWSVTAAGSRAPVAAAGITYGWGLAATGSAPDVDVSEGYAAITYTWALAASGQRQPTATASLTYTWALAATGDAPAVDIPEGEAAIAYTWALSASGHRAPASTATIAYAWGVGGAGRRVPVAAASVVYGWGLAVGVVSVGRARIWRGGVWVPARPYVWDGSAWQPRTVM